MLDYLWSTMGTYMLTLHHFEVLMKQLLFQKWVDGINFIFKSYVTKQMILNLSCDERSCFIENFIGDPFAKELESGVRNCLVTNLCEAPYAGALAIFILDNFEDLSTFEPRTSASSATMFSKSLVRGRRGTIIEENTQIIFESAWSKCLQEIYPMEI